MARHKVIIEVMIEDITKEMAIKNAQKLCDTINAKNPKNKAWVRKMLVDTKEETQDTSEKEIDKF